MLRSIAIRAVYNGYFIFTTLYVQQSYRSLFWVPCLAVYIVLQLLEIICLVTNRRQEGKYFSTSALFFILSTTPMLWLVELQRDSPSVHQSHLFTELTHRDWLRILKQIFLWVLLFGRLVQPTQNEEWRAKILPEAKFYFMLSTDVTELFECLDDPRVSGHCCFPYAILSVFSLSTFPFVLLFEHTNNKVGDRDRNERANGRGCQCPMSSQHTWLLTVLLMDLPYFGVRVAMMVSLNMFSYNMIFYSVKNLMMILFLIIYGVNQLYASFSFRNLLRCISK